MTAARAAPQMNLLEARVVLRQRAFLDVVDLAVRFVAAHAQLYFSIAMAVLAPAFFATWLLGRSAGWLFGWGASLALALLAEAPFTVLASRLMFSDRVDPRDALRVALRSAPQLLGIRAVQLVALSLSLVLLVSPRVDGAVLMFARRRSCSNKPGSAAP